MEHKITKKENETTKIILEGIEKFIIFIKKEAEYYSEKFGKSNGKTKSKWLEKKKWVENKLKKWKKLKDKTELSIEDLKKRIKYLSED